MQQLGRDSGGQRAIQVPWLHPSHLIYLLATSLILLTCHDLSCQALAHNATASSSQRHTRRVLIVQEETVAGRLLNGSGESSFPSPAYDEAEEAEQDDDLLQEEEFKRRLTDVDAPTAQVAGPIATNSTTKNLQESPAQTTASSQDEEEEQERKQPGESPYQVQVKQQQQQPTTGGEAGLVAAFFSHIDKQWKFAEIVLIIVISAILNLVTIIGNIMVLISFKMDRSLQTVSNYFLLSLALADLLIGLISMPLYTLYLLLNYWPLGPLMCDIWLAIDYLNSNAAVLNMLIISFDRYFSVTRPLTYRAKRTTKHACLMISFAWLLSLTIWTPAIFTYPYYKGRTVQGTDKCEIEFVKANTYLTFVTAILAFYIPVAIMIYLYWRIWLETKKRYRDLTTLFLVSGVGAAAPTRPRPPAAALLSATLTGRGGGGDGRGGSLWARNLARARQYAPSLMRGPQKAASLTPRDSPPPQQPLDRKPLPPVLTLASKTTDRLAGASQVVAAIKERPLEAGCDRQTTRHGDTNVAADSSKPSKVGVVGGGGRAESNKSQSDQQVSTSFVQKKELKNSTRQTCKCRTCSTSSHSGQSPRVSDCKACARDATSSGRHKCATSRKGACCCCDSYTAAKCAIVQPHQHNRTKYDSTKQHKNSSSSCRYCAKLTGQHSAVVSHAHSPGTGMARPEGNSDLLTLADETQPITSKATTFGSRSSLCQRSKIHPKEEEQEEARPGSSESDETGQQPPETTRLLVDVATSPINFSNTSLALVGNTGQQQQQQQLQLKLDENVIKQQLGAPPLTPVSPEVEDFETRIVSYGHKFHFETDDPKLASKRDQQRTNPCHYHQHHNHLHQRHHHHHHHQNLAQISSTRWKPAGGKSASAQSRASAGKHGTTCCCAEVISAHDAECRFCRPTHRPAQHQLATRGSAHTNHAHHQHRHHHHSHAHVQGHAHAHGHAHSGHTHQQHNHHHHHHHHHHKHHTHKHVSPGKQCNKCPQVGAPRAPTNQTDERDASLGRSLPILAALQSTHAATAAAAATNAKKYGQKLTFSDILMERSSSCVTLEQQQQPDKSNNLQVALQVVAATHDQQASPAVSESDRELLARRNADRLRSAFEYEDDEDEDGEATDADAECRRVRPNWLMRLLISVGLAAPRSNNSRGPANYHARPQRPHVHEPQTTDSSDSSDPQQQDQGKLRSQQQQQPPHHSSSTKSSSSGSQQHQQPVASPHATGSDRYHGHHHHSHHNHHHHHHHHPIQPKSERKAAKTLSTLLLVFIVTWLPYNVLVLIKTLSGGEDMVPEKIWNFSYYLCYINSTINPLCYALCNAQFRRTYMRILKCKLSNEHNSTRRLVAIQSGGGGGTGGGGSSTAKDNASRLNSSSLDGAHLLNHSSSGATLGGGPQTAPAGRYRQSSASNGAHRHSGGGGRRS